MQNNVRCSNFMKIDIWLLYSKGFLFGHLSERIYEENNSQVVMKTKETEEENHHLGSYVVRLIMYAGL